MGSQIKPWPQAKGLKQTAYFIAFDFVFFCIESLFGISNLMVSSAINDKFVEQ